MVFGGGKLYIGTANRRKPSGLKVKKEAGKFLPHKNYIPSHTPIIITTAAKTVIYESFTRGWRREVPDSLR